MAKFMHPDGIDIPSDLDELDPNYDDYARAAEARREGEPSQVYELRGVLQHRGPSAYHGHYESQVYDVT